MFFYRARSETKTSESGTDCVIVLDNGSTRIAFRQSSFIQSYLLFGMRCFSLDNLTQTEPRKSFAKSDYCRTMRRNKSAPLAWNSALYWACADPTLALTTWRQRDNNSSPLMVQNLFLARADERPRVRTNELIRKRKRKRIFASGSSKLNWWRKIHVSFELSWKSQNGWTTGQETQ